MPKPKPKLVIVACVLATILVFQKYSPDQPDAGKTPVENILQDC